MAALFARSAAALSRNVVRSTAVPAIARRNFSVTPGRFEVIKKFTKDHEWISYDTDSKIATIGVTTYAASSLGDVVYVELEPVSSSLDIQSTLGVVESVKSASDVYSPIAGEIVETNENVVEKPALINADAEGEAWLVKVKVEEGGESVLEGLLDESGYEGFKAGEHH